MQFILPKGHHCFQEKPAIHYHLQKEKYPIKMWTIFHIQIMINCNFDYWLCRNIIFQVLGTPKDIDFITDERAINYIKSFGFKEKKPYKNIFKYLSKDA